MELKPTVVFSLLRPRFSLGQSTNGPPRGGGNQFRRGNLRRGGGKKFGAGPSLGLPPSGPPPDQSMR